MTPELKALEVEIFPQRKTKRIHITELQKAWAAYLETLEKPVSTWERFWAVVSRFDGPAKKRGV